MEAALINKSFSNKLLLNEVMASFFKDNTPDTTKAVFWKIFQCWALKDCKIKAEISDEEIALFFDQLNDLVAAAYILHQANRALTNEQEGMQHE